MRPLKIVVNSGNGAAGPTFDAIAEVLEALGAPLEFIRVHHTPDAQFPNGIPNPASPENHSATADVVMAEEQTLGLPLMVILIAVSSSMMLDNLCQ